MVLQILNPKSQNMLVKQGKADNLGLWESFWGFKKKVFFEGVVHDADETWESR